MTSVLLVNLGTPLTPNPKDVYRYLIEFLTDERVIDFSFLKRQLLVRGFIVPKRYKASAASYKEIWTEKGSPLMIHTQNVRDKLEKKLGDSYKIAFGMRYQKPSIEEGLSSLLKTPAEHLIILPLFPQYASATTGSVFQKVMELIKNHTVLPRITFLNDFGTHPSFIRAIEEVAKPFPHSSYDHVLFSFHGLPERQLRKANPHCFNCSNCCGALTDKNRYCYAAQCYATAREIRKALKIPEEKSSIAFQSRLGKEPWLTPYTSDRIHQLAKEKKKRVLVFSPSFVCDCLETTFEISVEYQKEFEKVGGEKLDLVPGLNDHDAWIEALADMIKAT